MADNPLLDFLNAPQNNSQQSELEVAQPPEQTTPIEFAQPPQAETSFAGEAGKGIVAGARDLYGTVGGLVGLAGDALGSDDLKSWGLNTYQEQQQAIEENNAPAVGSLKDIHDFDSFGKYASYGLAKTITEMVPLLATSEVGGLAAGGLAKEAVERATQYAVANGLDRAAAEKLVSAAVTRGGADAAGKSLAALTENATERGMAEGAASNFAQQALDAGTSRANLAFGGAQVGNAAAMTAQSVGGEYGQTQDAGTALKYGSAEGLINAAAMGIAAAPIFRKALGISAGEASKGFGGFAAKFAKRSAVDAAVLGGTGYEATALSQQAEASVNPNFDPNSEEAKSQRMEAGLSGLLGAPIFGAIGALEGAHAPLTAQALRALDKMPEAKTTGASTAATSEEAATETTPLGYTPPGDRVQPNDENWSQPVYVNVNGRSIRMQKDLQLNRWVIPDPENLPEDIKSTGLAAHNGNVIIDPMSGPHTAKLHMDAENALDKLNTPAKENSDGSAALSNDELSKQTDTSLLVPANLSEKSAEESAQAIVDQTAAGALPLKSGVNESALEGLQGIDRRAINIASADDSGQSRMPFVFSDQKEKTESAPARPRFTRDADGNLVDTHSALEADEGESVVDNSDRANPNKEGYLSGLKSGDEVAFAHPDFGVVRATVERPLLRHEDDKQSDSIKLSFIDPKTEEKETHIVPRSSWNLIAPAEKKLPSFDDMVSGVTGDNPAPETLQQLGFANIQVSSDNAKNPGVSGDQVYWDGLGQRPSLGDYRVKVGGETRRVAESAPGAIPTKEASAQAQLQTAHRTGDYSGVTASNLIPVRNIYGAHFRENEQTGFPTLGVRSYGIFTGSAADTAAEIAKAKEMTLRQWNMGLPVIAKKGSYIPDGFQWERLANGKIKITAVEDYMGRTWRRGNTPESFTVDVPQTMSGHRSKRSGVGLFDHFFNTDPNQIEASEIAHEREAAKKEGQVSSALNEKLSPTETNFLDRALAKATNIISNLTSFNGRPVEQETRDKATDSIKARLIRQMVPPPKEQQVKQNAPSRANRPSWVTDRVSPEQAVRNNRVEHLFLNSLGHLEDLKQSKIAPDIAKRVANAESKIEPDTRSAKDQQFDPVRKTVTGLQASEIAKRAYTTAGEITPAEIRNIVQNIKDTNPDLTKAELEHLNRVSDYYQALGNKFSEANVMRLVSQEVGSASRRTVADTAFRGADNISKDNQQAGTIGENEMVLGSKKEGQVNYAERNKAANKTTFEEVHSEMSHGAPDYVPDHLTHGWEGGVRVPTEDSSDIDPMLGSLQQLDDAFGKLPRETQDAILKIGAKRITGYNSEEAKLFRAKVAPGLTENEQRVLFQERQKLDKAIEAFGLHLEAQAEQQVNKKTIESPLNKGEKQVMGRALRQLREILSPDAPEPRREPNTPLKVAPEQKKETPSGVTWTRDQQSTVNRLLKAKTAREKAAAEYRARIFAKLGEDTTTQNDVRTAENTPENASRSNDANGDETLRDRSSDEARTQGGFGSLAGETAEADYDGGHLGVRGSSDDASGDVRGSSDASAREGSGLGASPRETRSLAAGTRELIVRSAAGLSKEEAAKLGAPEIDRAYDALHNTADMRAVHGNEVIAGVSPRVEDIQSKSLKELLQGVADEQRRYFENSVRADQIRKNHGDAVRSGIFHSPVEFLKRVSEGKTDADSAAVLRAKALLAKQGKVGGYDWNHVATQVGSFRDGENRSPYGGYATKDGNIYLNLDAAHRGGSIVNTYLHELSHLVEKDKVDSFLTGKGVPLSSTERSALERVRKFQEDALRRLYSRTKGADPKASIEKMEKWAREKALASQEKNGNKNDRLLYPLSDLHETIRGLQDDPEFHTFIGDTGKGNLGYGAERASDKGITYSMTSDARAALNAITELNTGRKTDPNSPLARAFADSWEVTNSRMAKDNVPTALSKKLKDFNDREAWIRYQIGKRDLHGTSNDRMALRNEWDSMHGKVRNKAAYLPQPRPIELRTGTDIGYREPTPEPRAVTPKKVEGKTGSTGETSPTESTTQPAQSAQNSSSAGVIKAQERLLAVEDKIQELMNAGKIQMSESGQMMTNDPEAQAAFSERYAATQQLRAELKSAKTAKVETTPVETAGAHSKFIIPEQDEAGLGTNLRKANDLSESEFVKWAKGTGKFPSSDEGLRGIYQGYRKELAERGYQLETPKAKSEKATAEVTAPTGQTVTQFESPNAQYFDNVTKVPEVRALLKEAIAAIKARAEANPGGGTGFREQALLQELADKRIQTIKESRKAGNRPSVKEPITLQEAIENPEGVPPKEPTPTPEPPTPERSNQKESIGNSPKNPLLNKIFNEGIFGHHISGVEAGDAIRRNNGFDPQQAKLWDAIKTKFGNALPTVVFRHPLSQENRRRAGVYFPSSHIAAILTRSQNPAETFLHEIIHGLTVKKVNESPEVKAKISELMKIAKDAGLNKSSHYGMKNEKEFLAEAFTDKAFQNALRKIKIPSSTKTVWEEFTDWVASLVGLKGEGSLLDRVISEGLEIMHQNETEEHSAQTPTSEPPSQNKAPAKTQSGRPVQATSAQREVQMKRAFELAKQSKTRPEWEEKLQKEGLPMPSPFDHFAFGFARGEGFKKADVMTPEEWEERYKRVRSNKSAKAVTFDTTLGSLGSVPANQWWESERPGQELLRLTREKGDSAFRFPYKLSDSTDLGEVLNSVNPNGEGVSHIDAYGATLISKTPVAGDRVVFSAPDGKTKDGFDYGRVLKVEDGIATVRPDGPARIDEFTIDAKDIIDSERYFKVYDSRTPGYKKNEIAVDSSAGGLPDGTLENSSEIYQGIYQWAHNTGRKVVPDTQTSWAGNYRRNAHQLSSALRNQSAEHFLPTAEQRGRMFPWATSTEQRLEEWNEASTEEKISALARAERSFIEQAMPEIVQYSYDPIGDQFIDRSTGESHSADSVRERLHAAVANSEIEEGVDPLRVGKASIARYLATKESELREAGGLSRLGERDSGNLNHIFYSLGDAPEGGGVWQKAKDLVPEGAKETLGGKLITTYKGSQVKVAGLFGGPDKGVSRETSHRYQQSRGVSRAAEEGLKVAHRTWVDAVKSEYPEGMNDSQLEVTRTALGNYGNDLSDKDIDAIAKEQSKNGYDSAVKLSQKLTQKNREEYRAEQQKALDSLPPKTRAAIVQYRDQIDALTQGMIQHGIVTGDLKATLEANRGIYITRSYSNLDGMTTHADMIKRNPELAARMETKTRDYLAEQMKRSILSEASKKGEAITDAKAKQIAKDRVTDEMVHASLDRLLSSKDNMLDSRLGIGQFPGRKDLSQFKKRGNLDADLREYLGERKDPALIAADTISRQAGVLANHSFLSELRAEGLKDGTLYDPNAAENRGLPIPNRYVRVAAENNPAMAPLNGLYIHKDIGDGLYQMLPKLGAKDTPWLLDMFKKVTGYSMGAKTQFSPAAQVRHNVSNLLGLVTTANNIRHLYTSYKRINPFKALEDSQAALPEIQRLTTLGLLHQSEANRLLRDLIGEHKAPTTSLGQFLHRITSPVLDHEIKGVKLREIPETLYGVSDAAYKVAIFYGECEKYAKAFPEWTQSEVERKAAQIALDCHWTYDRSPAIVKELSKVPIIAPFVRFSSEVYRTSYNLLKLAREEIKEGNATGNAELTKMGWNRVKGIATVALGPSALIAMTQAASGMTDEDQEALRQFLPDWQKNAQIIPFHKADGKVGYFDLSWWDHYKILRTPLKAVVRSFHNDDGDFGKGLHDAMIDGMRELFEPFDKEQLTTSAIMDIARNKNSANGAPLYNPQDSAANIGLSVANRLWTALSPGAVDSINRVYKGVTGYVSDSGRSYDAGQEIANMIGWRAADINLANSLHFAGSQFMQQNANASQLLSHAVSSVGSRTEQQVVDGYNQANAAHQKLIEDLRTKYEAAIQLGMTPAQIQMALKGSRISQDVIDQVVKATYNRLQPSKAVIKLLQSRGQQDRIQWLSSAVDSAPPVVNLPLGSS